MSSALTISEINAKLDTLKLNNITIIDNEYENAVHPSEIKIPLKAHQLKMLKKCLDFENGNTSTDNTDIKFTTNIGIIGNPVGSGKSLIMLSIMVHPLQKLGNTIITNTENYMFYKTNVNEKDINVLLVPHSIFQQWKTCIQTQTNLNFEYIDTKKKVFESKLEHKYVMTSSSIFTLFAEKLNSANIVVSRWFIDEADSIRIPNFPKINYKFCWFVTSSIINLILPKLDYYQRAIYSKSVAGIPNNGFIKNIFVNLANDKNKEYRKHLFLLNSEESIKQSFNLTDYIVYNYLSLSPNVLNVLESLIPDNIQAMICAGDIDGAIEASSFTKTDNDNLISIICENILDKIANKKIDLQGVMQKIYKSANTKQEAIERITNEINHLEQRIENIKQKIKDCNMDPITFCDIEKPTIVTCCNQVFDFESITIFMTTKSNPKCPCCRTEITKDSIVIVSDTVNDEEETKEEETIYTYNTEEHSKLENLEYILKEKVTKNAKILIFTAFDKSFSGINDMFDKLDIKYKYINGTGHHIKHVIEWFQEDSPELRVLLLNAHQCGAGLNLQNATDVITYHKMDKALETQIIGRAQRPGRTSTLKVHNLLYEAETR